MRKNAIHTACMLAALLAVIFFLTPRAISQSSAPLPPMCRTPSPTRSAWLSHKHKEPKNEGQAVVRGHLLRFQRYLHRCCCAHCGIGRFLITTSDHYPRRK